MCPFISQFLTAVTNIQDGPKTDCFLQQAILHGMIDCWAQPSQDTSEQ